jgi:hypothetical protein
MEAPDVLDDAQLISISGRVYRYFGSAAVAPFHPPPAATAAPGPAPRPASRQQPPRYSAAAELTQARAPEEPEGEPLDESGIEPAQGGQFVARVYLDQEVRAAGAGAGLQGGGELSAPGAARAGPSACAPPPKKKPPPPCPRCTPSS